MFKFQQTRNQKRLHKHNKHHISGRVKELTRPIHKSLTSTSLQHKRKSYKQTHQQSHRHQDQEVHNHNLDLALSVDRPRVMVQPRPLIPPVIIVSVLVCVEHLLAQDMRKQVELEAGKREELQVLVVPSWVLDVRDHSVVNSLREHHSQIRWQNRRLERHEQGEQQEADQQPGADCIEAAEDERAFDAVWI